MRYLESSAVESCGTLLRCRSPGKLLRDSALRDVIGGWSPSAPHMPESQTPGRKAGVQHKAHGLH